MKKNMRVERSNKNQEDPYLPRMRESIEKVEATREERIDQEVEPLDPETRDKVLNEFHPDYIESAFREVKVGPNAGEKMPKELVDLLEAYPKYDPSEVNLAKVEKEVDVLIIGGGGAGNIAAYWAVQEGLDPSDILIATKLRNGDSNSVMSQGGVQAADRDDDSPAQHYLDIVGGGHYANKPELVKALVKDAPKMIEWHEDLGVIYDKDEDGSMKELHGGGTSRKRLHSARDYTGLEIVRVVRDEVRNMGIPVKEFAPAVELLTGSEGTVTGAVLYNMETDKYSVVKAKSVVLATGGFGRLHIQDFPTTNHYGATADGLVLGYRAGANMLDMDTVQYHPTGAAYPQQILGLLVTEKVRSSGAYPVNSEGEFFTFNLEPRDVEASMLIRECRTEENGGRGNDVKTPGGVTGVWLDTPMIDIKHGEGAFEKNLEYIYRLYTRFGIDPTEDPILVYPTLHYQNGGIEIDKNGHTAVEGLLAAGEVEGGVHGKNRLMGNSIMDYNVFGRRAGIAAARRARNETGWGEVTLEHVEKYIDRLEDKGVELDKHSPMIIPDYRGERTQGRTLDLLDPS